ncbi:MAG: hypothetical protein ACLVJH_14410 [Faecalibacterium prausnitzii]
MGRLDEADRVPPAGRGTDLCAIAEKLLCQLEAACRPQRLPAAPHAAGGAGAGSKGALCPMVRENCAARWTGQWSRRLQTSIASGNLACVGSTGRQTAPRMAAIVLREDADHNAGSQELAR